MNSLIVACGYYQYNMLNINNLFQNGIIMILNSPPKLHKIFILCNYSIKIKLCQYLNPYRSSLRAPIFLFQISFIIRSKVEYLENLKHNLIKHFLPSNSYNTFQMVNFITFTKSILIDFQSLHL